MQPDEFEVLLRLVPDETGDEFWHLVQIEKLSRCRAQDEAVAVSGGEFIVEQWSSELIETYKSNSVLGSLGKTFKFGQMK